MLEPGGTLVTVLWASPDENPWFAVPREAIGAVLGADRAAFARAFGKLGDPDEAAAAHRAAGLVDVEAAYVRGIREAVDSRAYWQELSAENGHFRRVAASLNEKRAHALLVEMGRRLAPYGEGDRLVLPRTQVMVTARR